MVLDIVLLAAGAVMIAAGIGAVLAKSLLVSIILSGGVSLVASLVFLLIGAPDVAMTEAAIGWPDHGGLPVCPLPGQAGGR